MDDASLFPRNTASQRRSAEGGNTAMAMKSVVVTRT
jgi:hypothetical protein